MSHDEPGDSGLPGISSCARGLFASIAQNSQHSFIDDLSALFVATMGKKAKSTAKIQKANDRKIDKSTLPPPPPPPEEEVRTFYKTRC